jgi:hypothetical protein
VDFHKYVKINGLNRLKNFASRRDKWIGKERKQHGWNSPRTDALQKKISPDKLTQLGKAIDVTIL